MLLLALTDPLPPLPQDLWVLSSSSCTDLPCSAWVMSCKTLLFKAVLEKSPDGLPIVLKLLEAPAAWPEEQVC
jgi:hypothetical protein